MRFVTVLTSLWVLSVTAPAQDAAGLLGKWSGTDDDNRSTELVFEADVLIAPGTRVPYSIIEPGKISLGDPPYSVMAFEVRGDRLTLRWKTWQEEEANFRRVVVSPEQSPHGAGSEGDPFARTFAAEGVVLVLRGTAEAGYTGQLALEEAIHSVAATLDGEYLRGTCGSAESSLAFKGTLQGDELTLVIGEARYKLRGEPLLPPELEGVYEGKTHRFEHPRDWFGFDLPRGWSVGPIGDEGLTIDLGLPPYGTPEAIVGMLWGRVPEEDQNRPVAQVMEKYVPTLRQALREQGLIIRKPDGPIGTYRGKDVPGAVARFEGSTNTGVSCVVWGGSIIKRNTWITVCGVYAAEKEETYLPKLKRIFVTLEPRPPERNPELEALLVGKTFSSSQYGRVTQSAHHASYTFAPHGVVHRRLMSNIISQPGLPGSTVDSERSGRYEVCGDVLFLFFETGQQAGQVLFQGAQVVGFRIGGAQYR